MSIFMPRRGKFADLLSDISTGASVALVEGGNIAWYCVSSGDYEPGLNSGRVLLARIEAIAQLAWNSSGVNSYAGSTIDQYLTGDYLDLFSPTLRQEIGQTVLRYTPGNGSNTVTTISRAAFLPSIAELGLQYSGINVEGSTLPASTILQDLYTSGGAQVYGWTRSPRTSNTYQSGAVYGDTATVYSVSAQQYFRPLITLPATTLIDPYSYKILL